MGHVELANEIAVLSGGRRASWSTQAAFTDAPATDNAGLALSGALKTIAVVDLRDQVHRRSCKFTVATVDDTQTYRVVIDGNNVDYVAIGGDLLQDILEGIRDAINADVVVNLIVLASVTDDDADSVDDTVLIRGLAEDHYTVDHSVTAGPAPNGNLAAVADPDTATVRIYLAAGGLPTAAQPPGWRGANGGVFTAVTFRGFAERFDTASWSRLYVEVDDMGGTGDASKVGYAPGRVIVAPSPLP